MASYIYHLPHNISDHVSCATEKQCVEEVARYLILIIDITLQQWQTHCQYCQPPTSQ